MKLKVLALSLMLILLSAAHGSGAAADDAWERYKADIDTVRSWLNGKPKLLPADPIRSETLEKLDPVLSVPRAKELPCVGDYFRERMRVFLADFVTHKPERGVSIWKLYNHGFVLRTKDVTIGIDIIPGVMEIALPGDVLDALVDGVDVLLVTHVHGDHVTPEIVRRFVEKGKTVIAPTGMWQPGGERADIFKDSRLPSSILDGIVYMRSSEIRITGASIRSFGTWQKQDRDNVYLITFDAGPSVMHIGDMNVSLFKPKNIWYRNMKSPLYVDILIPNCWCPDLADMKRFITWSNILAGHEHELGHPVEGRRSYVYVHQALGSLGTRFFVPAWGERFDWPGDRSY